MGEKRDGAIIQAGAAFVNGALLFQTSQAVAGTLAVNGVSPLALWVWSGLNRVGRICGPVPPSRTLRMFLTPFCLEA